MEDLPKDPGIAAPHQPGTYHGHRRNCSQDLRVHPCDYLAHHRVLSDRYNDLGALHQDNHTSHHDIFNYRRNTNVETGQEKDAIA